MGAPDLACLRKADLISAARGRRPPIRGPSSTNEIDATCAIARSTPSASSIENTPRMRPAPNRGTLHSTARAGEHGNATVPSGTVQKTQGN